MPFSCASLGIAAGLILECDLGKTNMVDDGQVGNCSPLETFIQKVRDF